VNCMAPDLPQAECARKWCQVGSENDHGSKQFSFQSIIVEQKFAASRQFVPHIPRFQKEHMTKHNHARDLRDLFISEPRNCFQSEHSNNPLRAAQDGQERYMTSSPNSSIALYAHHPIPVPWPGMRTTMAANEGTPRISRSQS
jgi:hypothetical protein